jgi:hypothetical protein
MSHGTEEHLEHAEHVQHAAHDPFDRHVAMTMVIVAAVLAVVTMFSHREHNATLLYQTKANILHTKASDQWGYYQAKKNRQYLYEADADLLPMIAKDSSNPKATEDAKARTDDWRTKSQKYQQDGSEIENKARELEKESEELQAHSEEAHHRADRFDLGELGVELALVLCSVALLTKRREFWYSGIGIGLLGGAVATSGFFLH